MSRLKIAAGNWKMNNSFEDGLQLTRSLANESRPDNVLTILGAPFIHLKTLVDLILHVPNIQVAAQNLHHEEKGAYTGEVSASMLASINVPYVIIGHSERRAYQKESGELLAKKAKLAQSHGITPIFCCGEELTIRKEERHVEFVTNQLAESLNSFSSEEISKMILAYEPVWAIGTGETASPQQAQEMHKEIRKYLARQFGNDAAQIVPILYGGSVNPGNAKELFSNPDVDGGLVGGASLKAETFIEIIRAF